VTSAERGTALLDNAAIDSCKDRPQAIIRRTRRHDPHVTERRELSTRILAVGLTLAVLLDTAGQLLWKVSIESLPSSVGLRSTLDAALHQPLFVVLIAVFLGQLVNWLRVLQRADLSYVQPITSLSYVTVCVLSGALLGEHVSVAKVIGVLCVLTGVALVSQSKRADTDTLHL
jgi:drug/metabolite transporter (DMT)-like permease